MQRACRSSPESALCGLTARPRQTGWVWRRHPSRARWPRAWELRANLSSNDALYVALAEQLDAPLLTADARLARAPGLRCSVQLIKP